MKEIFIITILLFSFGCNDYAETKSGKEIKDWSNKIQEVCINGHVYYKFVDMMSPRFSDNGLIIKCEKLKGIK